MHKTQEMITFFVACSAIIMNGCSTSSRSRITSGELRVRHHSSCSEGCDRSVYRILGDLWMRDKEYNKAALKAASEHKQDQRLQDALLAFFLWHAPGWQPESWYIDDLLAPMMAQGFTIDVRNDRKEYHIHYPGTRHIYVVSMISGRCYKIMTQEEIDNQ